MRANRVAVGGAIYAPVPMFSAATLPMLAGMTEIHPRVEVPPLQWKDEGTNRFAVCNQIITSAAS
jgi:hypothetical protein